MKLKDFVNQFDYSTEFTITDNAFHKNNGKYYSFRTVYFHEMKQNFYKDMDNDEIFDCEVIVASVAENTVNVDVKSFVD